MPGSDQGGSAVRDHRLRIIARLAGARLCFLAPTKNRRRRKMKNLSLASLLLLAIAAAVLIVGLAPGFLSTAQAYDEGGGPGGISMGFYTHDTGGCTTSDRVDPIGAFFYSGAYNDYPSNSMHVHAGWGQTIIEGPAQYFAMSGVCREQINANADGCWNCDRNHIRNATTNNPNYNWDWGYGWWQLGSPHREVWVNGCGHAVLATVNGTSGYDLARARLANLITHSNFAVQYGNTQPMLQSCTGRWAASQGYIRHIEQHGSYH
jgi:hypothetical protein